jgi:hypothetical protein
MLGLTKGNLARLLRYMRMNNSTKRTQRLKPARGNRSYRMRGESHRNQRITTGVKTLYGTEHLLRCVITKATLVSL